MASICYYKRVRTASPPDLVISPLTGKFSHFDDSLYQALRNNSSVAYYNQIVEEKALVKYDDKLSPVTIKGVADDYARNTHFEDNIIQGTFQLKTGDTYKSVRRLRSGCRIRYRSQFPNAYGILLSG